MTEPFVKIRPPRGWSLPDVRAIWNYRELLHVLGVRDVTVRYRQTVVGPAWLVFGPLLSAGIFSFIFGRVAKLPSNGIPYFAFSYAGLLGWNVFSGTFGKVSSSMLSNAALISKIYFPRLVLPLSSILGTLVNFAVAFGVMLVLLFVYGLGIHVQILLLPVWIVLLLMLSLGLGTVLAALAVPYRDMNYVGPLIVSLLMYISPVAYGAGAIPDKFQTVYVLNPLAGLLEGLRWSIFGQAELGPRVVAYSVVVTILTFVAGGIAFTRMEPRFTDVI